MASIELRGVSRVHTDGTAALSDVDLGIADGEMFGVIGPSGSGKSTLLDVIAGLVQPAVGDVLVGGRSVAGLPHDARRLAYVGPLQDLSAVLSAAEEVVVPPGLRRIRPEPAPRHRRPGRPRYRVSHEQMVRTLQKRSLALLLNKPMQSMDAVTRTRLLLQLLSYHRVSGMTVVFATNHHPAVLGAADRVAVLRDGRVAQVGTPEELIQRPRSAFVAGNVGEQGVGMITARVQEDAGLGWLHIGTQRLRYPGGLPGPLRQRDGELVSLGARPNHIRESRREDPLDARLEASVTRVRLLGGQVEVDLDLPGGRWKAWLSPSTDVRPGQRLEVTVDVRRLLIFDPIHGDAVWHGLAHQVS